MTPLLIEGAIYLTKENELLLYVGFNKTMNPYGFSFKKLNKPSPSKDIFFTLPCTVQALNKYFKI